MKSIIPIYKFPGETPLDCINRFRQAFPEYQNISITYAGRLDPMADGLLLLLAGEEVHKKDEWLGKNKTYLVTILFGVETDSYDLLGRIKDLSKKQTDLSSLSKTLQTKTGIFDQTLPPYSAYKVRGKALFEWAQENRLSEIEIPSKKREIYSIELIKTFSKTSKDLLQNIEEQIQKVSGNFRQEEILENWIDILKNNKTNWQLATINVNCSSGTYMRSLAHEVGKTLKTSALAYSITRTSLEEFKLSSTEPT